MLKSIHSIVILKVIISIKIASYFNLNELEKCIISLNSAQLDGSRLFKENKPMVSINTHKLALDQEKLWYDCDTSIFHELTHFSQTATNPSSCYCLVWIMRWLYSIAGMDADSWKR